MLIRPNVVTRPGALLSVAFAFVGYAAAQSASLTTIHEFKGVPDGANPSGPLVADSKGVLYGTTTNGGLMVSSEPYEPSGCGIVFSMTPPAAEGARWTETILHSFTGGADGCGPGSGVVFGRNGVLYGTTSNSVDGGTAFSLTPPSAPGSPWSLTTIHTFAGGPNDAASPIFALTMGKNDVLFGAGFYGGDICFDPSSPVPAFGCGAVFALAPPTSPGGPWTEPMVFSIGAIGDGPTSGVAIGSGGVLYGVTAYGGGAFGGPGVLYSLAPPSCQGCPWTQTMISNFTTSSGKGDGSGPGGLPIIGPQGIVFGTTNGGGLGSGEVYAVLPPSSAGGAWTYDVLYMPPSLPPLHSSGPSQLTLAKNGVLYSTIPLGGANYAGEIFSLTPPTSSGEPWTETTLFSFGGNGYSPNGGLVVGPDGRLFGTTAGGYPGSTDEGTVFILKLSR